jgi:hypothetical protein
MSATADSPSVLEHFGVTDCEMIVRMRMPTNLHQKDMMLPDGSVYQETILSKEAALRIYAHLHAALFGGTTPLTCHSCGEDLKAC